MDDCALQLHATTVTVQSNSDCSSSPCLGKQLAYMHTHQCLTACSMCGQSDLATMLQNDATGGENRL